MDIGSFRRVIEVAVQPAPTLAIFEDEPDFDDADSEVEDR